MSAREVTPESRFGLAEEGARRAEAWVADLGDGRYRNPVLHADYSDPDVVRVGEDYWMTASSFNHVPGLPILHSRDLVNWRLVGHALQRLVPEEVFRTPQHGKGVWAPALRHHAGRFYLYYPDPDFGIYLVTATDPRGPWSEPVLVKGGRGLIDPCPFWDEDGRLYLIHAWAPSRAMVGNALTLLELNETGTKVVEDYGYLVNGARIPGCKTLEGPKLYKREGWYYIFAPAGGVVNGWQYVFRSRTLRGAYESRVVLEQGGTVVNGPHQGALVDTPAGESWFVHFQDRRVYGRIVHLQPVRWEGGWPLMGTGVTSGVAAGEPVLVYRKPALPAQPVAVPPTTDEFDREGLGLQWQWQANPQEGWASLGARPGFLRLKGQPEPRSGNLYEAPRLLMQKFPANEFTVTTLLELGEAGEGARAGLVVFGFDIAWVGLRREGASVRVVQNTCRDAMKGAPEVETIGGECPGGRVYLRVEVQEVGRCRFSYSLDGVKFTPLGVEFTASRSTWVGAKVGLFAEGSCTADWDNFRVGPK